MHARLYFTCPYIVIFEERMWMSVTRVGLFLFLAFRIVYAHVGVHETCRFIHICLQTMPFLIHTHTPMCT